MLKFELVHIGIKQSRRQGFRYKRLLHSGIFVDKGTNKKSSDCFGTFDEWTNDRARDWIFARVKEVKQGRKVHIVCDCCDSRDLNYSCNAFDEKARRLNPNCYGKELVQLIISLAVK
ncbi:hypothetical protein EV06_1801 [Prochlorococcus sp. MIT 0602]|nr:hypothetical protein EV06_1801 [Prochlorococcus sp. MIT 0602]KGG15830.1 hypothetical protein EV07_1796 [Prochlorococcus sp. MIT 0603]